MASEKFIQKLNEMGWPQEFGEKLEIGDFSSNVGIAVLWSFRDVVSKNLEKKDYAVLGNYYDRKNGLEPLIRNCLANPNIRYIILLGNDKAQSKDVLRNFFEKGFDEKGFIFETDTKIPRGIPAQDLEKLRKNVKIFDVSNNVSDQNNPHDYARAIKEAIQNLEKKEPYDEPKLYEKPPLETDGFPSEKAGFVARGKTVGEVWLKMLHNVYNYGTRTKMYAKESTQVREIINLMAVVSDEDPDNPKMEPYFRFDEKYLKSYCDEICSDKVPQGTIYTYGSRLRAWDGKNGEKIDQIADMIEYLKKDTFRKSAVAQTWG